MAQPEAGPNLANPFAAKRPQCSPFAALDEVLSRQSCQHLTIRSSGDQESHSVVPGSSFGMPIKTCRRHIASWRRRLAEVGVCAERRPLVGHVGRGIVGGGWCLLAVIADKLAPLLGFGRVESPRCSNFLNQRLDFTLAGRGPHELKIRERPNGGAFQVWCVARARLRPLSLVAPRKRVSPDPWSARKSGRDHGLALRDDLDRDPGCAVSADLASIALSAAKRPKSQMIKTPARSKAGLGAPAEHGATRGCPPARACAQLTRLMAAIRPATVSLPSPSRRQR